VAALEGDCTSPIAALAELEGDEFVIRAAVGARGGDAPVVRAEAKRSASQVDNAVADALKSLRDQGVAKLLRGA
jgi:porphobilinogen deaminase